MKTSISSIRSLLHQRVDHAILFFLLCAFIAALAICEPLLLSDIINRVSDGTFFSHIGLLVLAILTPLARIALDYYKNSVLLKNRNVQVEKLSSALFSHVLHGKKAHLVHLSPSYLTSRIIEDTSMIEGILYFNLIDGGINFFLCIAVLIMMLRCNLYAFLMTALLIALGYYISFALPLTKIFKEYNETLARVTSQTVNTLSGTETIKSGAQYEKEGSRFRQQFHRVLRALYRKTFFNWIMRSATEVCQRFGYVLLILLCAILLARQSLTLAEFTLLLSLYNIIWSYTRPVASVIPQYKYGSAACDRACELLKLETESMPSSDPAPSPSQITFDSLCFSYTDGRPILNGISLIAKRGEITAIAGPSGCGKSTLIDLLLGLYEPDAGQILFDNKAMAVSDLIACRPTIGYVSQDSFLFDRSLRENLLYYTENKEADLPYLYELLGKMRLDPFLSSLKDGLDTSLENAASAMSGGERQRLCIVRELMKRPNILVLDEFTSHLDVETEEEIFSLLHAFTEDLIVIQVSHKASALAHSDTVYDLKDGRSSSQLPEGDGARGCNVE